MITRQHIVTEALSWIGTPYVKKGAPIKGVSADCASLILGVGKGAGVFESDAHMPAYKSNRHLFNTDEKYRQTLLEYGFEALKPSEAVSGDVVLFVMGNSQPASHTAILVDDGRMVHAWQTARKVALNRYDERWIRRARYAFRFPQVDA